MNINTIKHAIIEIRKAIECYLDIEKVDIDDIEPMRYPKGVKPSKIPPLIQHGSKGSSRMLFKRR